MIARAKPSESVKRGRDEISATRLVWAQSGHSKGWTYVPTEAYRRHRQPDIRDEIRIPGAVALDDSASFDVDFNVSQHPKQFPTGARLPVPLSITLMSRYLCNFTYLTKPFSLKYFSAPGCSGTGIPSSACSSLMDAAAGCAAISSAVESKTAFVML